MLFIGVFLLAVCVQAGLTRELSPGQTVGDEREYLAAVDASAVPWIRVPGYRWLVAFMSGFRGESAVGFARLAQAAIAALIVAVAALLTAREADTVNVGLITGLAVAVWLLASAERGVLAAHLWPDTLLGGLCLVFVMMLLHAQTPIELLWPGLIAAIATAIRVDSLGLVAAGLVAMAPDPGGLTAGGIAALGGPSLAVLLIFTLRNGLKTGTWLPDSTLLFNLRVSMTEAANPGMSVQALMRRTSHDVHGRITALPLSLADGLKALRPVLRRAQTIFGAESFVSQTLIQSGRPEYRNLGLLANRGFRFSLGWAFTLTAAGFALIWDQLPMRASLPVLAMLLLYSLLQSRSRYRIGVLPVMATLIAIHAPQVTVSPVGLISMAGLIAIVLQPGQRREF